MNKKIIELIKPNSYTYTRIYNTFVSDEWGNWTNSGVADNSLITNGRIYSCCTGYTATPSLPKPNSQRVIKGLRKAKSIRMCYCAFIKTLKGWYVREHPDAYVKLLDGYIMLRCGGYGSYISVGGTKLVNLSYDVEYDTSFYQDYMICAGKRYNYPTGVKLKYATGDSVYAYAYGGFITSNDYFQCYTDMYMNNFRVVHTT